MRARGSRAPINKISAKNNNGIPGNKTAIIKANKIPSNITIGPIKMPSSKNMPPKKIHIGAVIIRISKIRGDDRIKSKVTTPPINTPKTKSTSIIIAKTENDTKTTTKMVPKTVPVTNRAAKIIKSIVLGMKFQTNQVGHVKIAKGKNAVRLRT